MLGLLSMHGARAAITAALAVVSAAACNGQRAGAPATQSAGGHAEGSDREKAEIPFDPVGATILFAAGTSTLDSSNVQALDHLAAIILKAGHRSLAVHGQANEHLDLKRNLDLAEHRAQAVSRYLADRGLHDVHMVLVGREGEAGQRGRSCAIETLR
jgi:outer membrane protein OmpA-like peptidoglycan-associated protein